MLKRLLSLIIFLVIPYLAGQAQDALSLMSLMSRSGDEYRAGKLIIIENPAIDSLVNRYILYNSRINGMEGFRIQVYSSSNKNAREESGKVRAEFMSKFPDIVSYASFERPGYYKIRAGDYRSRVEGTRYLLMVRKTFPDAILVPDIVNFPDLNKK
jgi:hypothetical protein